MTQEEKTKRIALAEKQLEQAKANLIKVKREERERARKEQNHHKFLIGGIVYKYFPECEGFNEQELCRIMAGAARNDGIKNLIRLVSEDRKKQSEMMQKEENENGGKESDNS